MGQRSLILFLLFAALALPGVTWAQDNKANANEPRQEAEIRKLIEQLVLVDREAPDPKKLLEGVKKGELEVEEIIPPSASSY